MLCLRAAMLKTAVQEAEKAIDGDACANAVLQELEKFEIAGGLGQDMTPAKVWELAAAQTQGAGQKQAKVKGTEGNAECMWASCC